MIHVIVGPPCAGKSTYLNDHAKAGDLRVDFDQIAKCLGAFKNHDAESIVKTAAFAARDAVINVAMDNPDAESWIIHTSPTDEQMESYKSVNADVIVLDPGKDECLARAERDGRPERTIDAINQWYSNTKKRGNKMKTKEFSVKYDDAGMGTLEGYASTWIRKPDSYGDVVKEGAFTKSLEDRWNGGKGIPLLWSHQMDNLDAYIGTADADEDEKGLHFVATFDDTEQAQRVRELYKSGRLSKFSFAYNTLDESSVKLEDGTKANELRELDLYEISCVCVPANDDAGVTDVKSGRRNSKSDADKINQAISLLQDVLGELDDTETDDESENEPKANPAGEERTEAVEKRKSALLATINKYMTEEKS